MSGLITKAANEAISQKTAMATLGTGMATFSTGMIDAINPYVPLIGLCVTIIFAVLNLWINYKKYKIEKYRIKKPESNDLKSQ